MTHFERKIRAKKFNSAKIFLIVLLIVYYFSLTEGRMMHFYRPRRTPIMAFNNVDNNNIFNMVDPCTGQWNSPFIMGLINPCRPFCPPEPCWPSQSDLGSGSGFQCRFGKWISFDEDREIWLSAPISSSLSWHRADALARSINGQLMDVHTVADQERLHQLLQCYPMDTSVWLGASDLAVKGEWEWSSGRGRVNLAFWGPQQLSNDEQHCLQIKVQSGLWYIANCQPKDNKMRAYVAVRYLNREEANNNSTENDEENEEEYEQYSTSSSLTTTSASTIVPEITTEEYSEYYYDEYDDDFFVGTEPPPV